MATVITRDVLESHLKCLYKGHLILGGERGEKVDYELLLTESRDQVRLAATELLLTQHKAGEVLRNLTVTPTLLKQGAPLILNATVEGEGLSVCFDAIKRTDGPSALGGFHYVPILFHEVEKQGKEQRTLLELLGLILGTVQGKVPDTGVLIYGRGCETRRVKFHPGERRASRRMEGLREMRATGAPPRLILNPHCQVCEFRQRCLAEATAKDDLSLLRGMGEQEIVKYGRRGIFTVMQLSCTFRPPRRMKRPEERKLGHSYALQALSIREKKGLFRF